MFLFIICLGYLLGCVSTIAILIFLYVRYGLYTPKKIVEQEQYQTFQPLSENEQAKNSTVDAVNYLFQFLFQEMKDTSQIRRYVLKKLNIEFDDLKKTKMGKIFLQDISLESFSLGKECPIFSDIQLERQERDERHLIKEVVAKVNVDYKDGFSVVLDVKLVFGYKCQLSIKVNRIQGQLRLEFRREPFSHWLAVFQDEPFIDFEVKSYLSSRESHQLAQIISQQIRRVIRRKQTWPNYKIRYQPFFSKSKQSLSTEVLSPNGNNLIPGLFDITIKHCDRLSIPFEIFNKNDYQLLSIFLTININEQMCQDYLHINRDQWRKKQIKFIPKSYKINIKEVPYMDRTEFLIDEFDPIPNEMEDREAFKLALEDKNIFLLEIEGQQVKTLKHINRSIQENDEEIEILVGMPLLHSVRVRQKTAGEIDRSSDLDNSIQQQDSDLIKTKTPSTDNMTVIMMNADLLQNFQAHATPTRKAEAYVDINDKFEFTVGPNEHFLNICLWCKPPLGCKVPNPDKKLVLLGYTTVALSEIVLDAHMSFKRETQMTLNFRSVYSDDRTDLKSKNLAKLSKHKNYDDNMVHGFVTINIKHRPEIEMKFNLEDKKERSSSAETVIIEKDDELLTSINEEHELSSPKSTDHIFEDQAFSVETLCAYCDKKIWMKVGRQCRNCCITVHKKCEDKFSKKNHCTHESSRPKSTISEDEISIVSTDEIDPSTTTHNVSTKLGSTARRSFRRFRNKNANQTSTLSRSELSKDDESDNSSSSYSEKRLISNHPVQTSSKLANAASSAYSKFREFKTKRSSASEAKKRRSQSDSTVNENISEADLQDIIARCLSDENIDLKGLEDLFHEKAVDHTAVYLRASKLGPELFPDLTLEERKQKLDNEISRLQQEIDLQGHIRDEMIIEYNNNNVTDENAKRKIQAKIANVDEKIQALAALTIFYCSSLKYCCSEIENKDDNHNINSKTSGENSNDQLNDNDTE